MPQRTKSENEYLFASVRVRLAEKYLISESKLRSAAAAKGTEETEAIIASLPSSGDTPEKKLTNSLASAFEFAEEITPEPNIVLFLRYVYDCCNIKSALKCYFRGIECPEDEMLFSFGSIPCDKVKKMPEKHDFSSLPRNMSEAAEEAFDAYVKTNNPQLIDTILDRACFTDMLQAAEDSGESFAVELVKMKIDLTNIMMACRTMKMGSVFASELLRASLISGGNIPESEFKAESTEKLAEILRETPYSSLSELISGNHSSAELERACDNIYMQRIKSTKTLSFGAPLICAYLVASEYQVKNLRILLAGKRALQSSEKITERLRLSYV